ncbi:type II toxin-antitoxin system RelE/ParE family toxin [Rhizobium sp. LjRoot98]|nr:MULTISPECIES: type II toxin-antitoxin system RelE/ParE family toxin [unclassified Rhizobium]
MPPSRGYRLLPAARQDLENIWRYSFETWSLKQADDYQRQLVDTFSALATGRKRGRDLRVIRPGYFSVICNSHCIFYRHVETGILVVRVLHQRMDPMRHL